METLLLRAISFVPTRCCLLVTQSMLIALLTVFGQAIFAVKESGNAAACGGGVTSPRGYNHGDLMWSLGGSTQDRR